MPDAPLPTDDLLYQDAPPEYGPRWCEHCDAELENDEGRLCRKCEKEAE